MNSVAERDTVCVAVTRQASWEVCSQTDGCQGNTEGGGKGGREAGRESQLCQIGDKCLYCSNAEAGQGCQRNEKKRDGKTGVAWKKLMAYMPEDAARLI